MASSKINELRSLGWSIQDISKLAKELTEVFSEVQEIGVDKLCDSHPEPTPEEAVSNLLKEMGCRFSFWGYSYLKEAIIYCYEKGKLVSLSRELYPYIAEKYGTKSSRVERSIRYSIEKMVEDNKKYPKAIFDEVFGNSVPYNEGITNMTFIVNCVEYLCFH